MKVWGLVKSQVIYFLFIETKMLHSSKGLRIKTRVRTLPWPTTVESLASRGERLKSKERLGIGLGE